MRIGISSVAPHSYVIDDEPLCSTTVEKDLGVVVDQNLKFHQHAAAIATDSSPILCKTFVHPVLEYANSVWGPHYTDLRSENKRKFKKEPPDLYHL